MSKRQKYEAQKAALKKYKIVPHEFTGRVLHWPYCTGCGLVALKNEPTNKRMKQSCESMED